jgi:type I restriction enzyme S subunit
MTSELLLQYFNRISEAPDAVPRLRRFILDLAVRGKLVEQDLKDEPASELLKRIQAEKARLVKEGNLSKSDDLLPVAHDEELFPTPKSWTWVRIGTAVYVEMGQSPPSEFYNQTGEGIPFFQGKADFGSRHPVARYWCTKPTKYAYSGDILISVRAPVGPTNVADDTCCVGRGLAALRPYSGMNADFFLKCLKAFEPNLEAMGFGTTFVAINKKQLISFAIPLPPLTEQHRIVAKVDELMALCDQLEAARNERETRRDRLVASSLNRISTAAAEEAKDAARFHLDQLPRLTTRIEHIKQLRQTILNLAVRGRLVPQDPNDEPASELLKRIHAENVRLMKEGIQKKEAALPKIDLEQAPFDLPAGWEWARFPELGRFGRGKSKHRPRNDLLLFEDGTHLVIQTGDIARSHGVIKTYTSKYNEVGLAQSMKWPTGTLCITIAANIADSGILSFDACFPDSVVGFIPASVFQNARYFEYFVRTAKANLLAFAPATAQKNINLEILNSVMIPLPPLAEQHRIVAKVDELMALCDQLETQITATETDSRRLLEAVLRVALDAESKVAA